MERRPTKSARKCIGEGCDQLPTIVLRGRHEGRQVYEVQIMSCEIHVRTAWEHVRSDPKLRFIAFAEMVRPRWLAEAQKLELEQGKVN